jgi:N utilization substance protein B
VGGAAGDGQLATLQTKLQELEATVARLRQTGHSVVSQRDAARAEAASLRVALGAAQQELARVRQHGEFEVRAKAVLRDREGLDARIDAVMEGWRLTRLPRVDRDILRLAVVDLEDFATPPAVACNEAVELANRYSDDQGRRMINGVLRRFTAARV